VQRGTNEIQPNLYPLRVSHKAGGILALFEQLFQCFAAVGGFLLNTTEQTRFSLFPR
jgi:hypothetical protein